MNQVNNRNEGINNKQNMEQQQQQQQQQQQHQLNNKNNSTSCIENTLKSKEPLPLSILFIIFSIAITCIIFLFLNFPSLKPEHKSKIHLPKNFQDVQTLSEILSQYTDDNYFIVINTFGFIYIFLQAFSIPGSIFLSFLSGGLFGLWVGFPLVCLVATIGATCSYLISYYICRNLVFRFFPDKLSLFAHEVDKRRRNLLNYLIFLRITPFLPNWFINLASPLLEISISTFAIGTFIGIMPATFLAVKAGLAIQEISKPGDIFDAKSIVSMALLAVLSILPTLEPVRKRLDVILNRENNNNNNNNHNNNNKLHQQ